MILDLDLGNSSGKWRVMDEKKNLASGHFFYSDLISFFAFLPKGIRRIRAVSVLAVEKQNAILQAIEEELSIPVDLAVVEKSAGGISNGYENFQQLGADRWLVIVAAWRRVAGACLVIDAGSALTIDCIGNQGNHLGGYIIPGMSMMRNLLVSGTGRIQVDGDELALLPGKNTAQAVGHGSLLAAVSIINNVEKMFISQFETAPQVLITGGDAKYLLPFLTQAAIHVPDLVFEGLEIVLP